jgi:hypothetical protein
VLSPTISECFYSLTVTHQYLPNVMLLASVSRMWGLSSLKENGIILPSFLKLALRFSLSCSSDTMETYNAFPVWYHVLSWANIHYQLRYKHWNRDLHFRYIATVKIDCTLYVIQLSDRVYNVTFLAYDLYSLRRSRREYRA